MKKSFDAGRHYAVQDVDAGATVVRTGAELMDEGLSFDDLQPIESRVLLLRPVAAFKDQDMPVRPG